ncbi:RNI-like protein [Fomitopsis serialis]|uniref:RNI-like protein n=1 Tax=Fomitopsis serialis TaxID=139415 RepID=UPI00200825C3|nr:RNI-like protein [Neoantrodia serialis]KAH9921033.1 RNI-like protein [Neoantrodia serialis]
MSRRPNNVRGPTSALTDFLRESGITATTIARRARTRIQDANQDQPEAGPSTAGQDQDQAADGSREEHGATENGDGYDSDNLDEPEEEAPAPKKRKLSKAAEAKLKEKEKAKAKKKAKKGGDDDDDYDDSDYDPYNALSKMWKGDLPKPPVGSFEKCAKCATQFTVTKYTLAANPPPGWLCHPCAKSGGSDPFKKPAAPRKRKAPADRRVVVHFEERKFPTLVSLCIDLISTYIDDVEALGDIGNLNMDEIAKTISKSRKLTAQNAPLFYDVQHTRLSLYDVTNLEPPALCALANLNLNLTHLRLDYCGRINDEVMTHWKTALPNLKRLELLGPFLVRTLAWQDFLRAHPSLEGFLITQSPRFDLDCMRALVESCKGLKELRLSEIGLIEDAFLKLLKPLAGTLTSLEISKPGSAGTPDPLSEEALIDLVAAVGGALTHLDLSSNRDLTDQFLFKGLKPHMRQLTSLKLVGTPELTNAGVAEFFDTWVATAQTAGKVPNPPLEVIDISRNHQLGTDALFALLEHSGPALRHLNVHDWKETSQDSLQTIAARAPNLRTLDIGFCREVDDWVVKSLVESCQTLSEVKVWGCQRLTVGCPRKRGINIIGVEAGQLVS